MGGFNSLNSLDVSANTALIDLRVPGNQLISMDVSTNIALEHLDFWVNQLTALDVSANTALTTLKASSNDIIALDVSAERLAFAKTFGAEVCLDAGAEDLVATIKDLTHGVGVNKALDCSGAESARLAAVQCTRTWGTVGYVGEAVR